MFYNIMIVYTVLVIVFLVIAVLDWTLGIDKLDSVLERINAKINAKINIDWDFETFIPTMGLTIVGLFTLFLYACTGWVFFHMIYFFSVGIALVILGMIIVGWIICKILSSIRKYFISKKRH